MRKGAVIDRRGENLWDLRETKNGIVRYENFSYWMQRTAGE